MDMIRFIFLFVILCGCSSPQSSTDLERSRQGDSGVFAVQTICNQDDRCVIDCRELFVGDSDHASKCMKQTVGDVRVLKTVIALMEKGSWSSVKPDQLERALEFDSDLWLPYVSANKSHNREFLKFIAEEPQAAELIDDNEILRQAFMSLVLLGSPDDKVLDGMQRYVDEDDNQTFFGVAALNKNNEAFEEGHRLLSDVCQQRKLCLQRVYCGIYEDIVFARLNELNLSDEVTDGEHISVSICN